MENNDDLTAPYQSQEAVYGFMLEDLDHAVNVLETYITLAGTDVVAEAASADYVYNGNLANGSGSPIRSSSVWPCASRTCRPMPNDMPKRPSRTPTA